MTLRAIDWFAGRGGYTAALLAAGHRVVGACECDEVKRQAYVESFGPREWFGHDCLSATTVPTADLWCACESNPRLVAWVNVTVAQHRPQWVWCETVRQREGDVVDALERCGYVVSQALAGCRVHLVAGPVRVTLPALDEHDARLGPGSDPRTLARVLGALAPGVET